MNPNFVPDKSEQYEIPDPKTLPEFPAQWPSKPIPYMPTDVTDYFVGPFKIQVHPQKIIIPKNGKFKFGIKNPTDKPVAYYLEHYENDVHFEKAKGGSGESGYLDPGEIVRLTAVHKEEISYDTRKRTFNVCYQVLDKKEDAEHVKAKSCPPKDEEKIKGRFHSKMIVDPEPEIHEKPKSICPYDEGSSGYWVWAYAKEGRRPYFKP